MDSSALISRGTAGCFVAIVVAALAALALAPGAAGAATIPLHCDLNRSLHHP